MKSPTTTETQLTPIEEFTRFMLLAMNEYAHRQHSEATKAGIRASRERRAQRRASGRATTGRPRIAVAYLDTRFRTAPDAERDLGDQRRACEDYARQHGLHLDACYTDIRASGRIASRTALDRLIADIRRGYVSHVVIVKPLGDGVELARRVGAQADMMLAAKRLREAGAIVTVMRHAPTATYQGEGRL